MLLNGLYTIKAIIPEDFQFEVKSDFIATICLNPKHEIYSGHFPGNPVTPGVCLIQIIREIAEIIIGGSSTLTNISNVKFLTPVVPDSEKEFEIKLSILKKNESQFELNAQIFDTDVNYLKLQKAILQLTN